MQAKDIMTTNVTTVSSETPVSEVARLLLSRHVGAVPVVNADGTPVGMVSEGDLMRRADSGTERHPHWWLSLVSSPDDEAREYVRSHGMLAGEVMSGPVIAIAEDTPAGEIADRLEGAHVERVPVLRDGHIVGIVSRADLLRALAFGEPPQRTGPMDDRSLQQHVAKAIDTVKVPSEFVTVTVADGKAHLWGAAESDDIRKAIRVAAEEVAGPDRVHGHIRVLSPNLRALLWV